MKTTKTEDNEPLTSHIDIAIPTSPIPHHQYHNNPPSDSIGHRSMPHCSAVLRRCQQYSWWPHTYMWWLWAPPNFRKILESSQVTYRVSPSNGRYCEGDCTLTNEVRQVTVVWRLSPLSSKRHISPRENIRHQTFVQKFMEISEVCANFWGLRKTVFGRFGLLCYVTTHSEYDKMPPNTRETILLPLVDST